MRVLLAALLLTSGCASWCRNHHPCPKPPEPQVIVREVKVSCLPSPPPVPLPHGAFWRDGDNAVIKAADAAIHWANDDAAWSWIKDVWTACGQQAQTGGQK